jgi:ABC-type polysaccharide/polyol phosphate export permease
MVAMMLIGLAVGLVVAIVVFVATGGHVLFLPLLFVPLAVFSLGLRRGRPRD